MAKPTDVLGLDLSLASTGIVATNGHDELASGRFRTLPKWGDLNRIRAVRNHLLAQYIGPNLALAVVEGPSYGHSRQGGEHVRAGLWWLIADLLDSVGLPLLVVPPATLKTYATGKGNSSKDQVLAAVIKRYGALMDITGNDVADAMVLCAIGSRMLGEPLEESLPATHLRALDKLQLPEGTR